MSVTHVSTPSGIEFRNEVPNPGDDMQTLKAIAELSRFPIARCFQEVTVVDSEDYTMEPERDRVVLVSDSLSVGGGVTITLPDPAYADAVEYVVRNIDTNTVTVATPSGSIEGGSLTSLLGGRWATDGTDYWLTGGV